MKKVMFFVMFALAIAMQAQAGLAYLKKPGELHSLDEAKVRYQAYINALEKNDATFFNIAPAEIKKSLISRWNARGYQPTMTDQNIFTILRDASKVELKSVTFTKGELKVGYVTGGKLSWWERANYGGGAGEWIVAVKQDPLNGEFVSLWCGNDLERKVKKIGATKIIDTVYQVGAHTIVFNPTINVEVNPIIENNISTDTEHLQERYSPFNPVNQVRMAEWQPTYVGGGDTYAPTRNVTISMFNGGGGFGFGGGWNQGFGFGQPFCQPRQQCITTPHPNQPVRPVPPVVDNGGPYTGPTHGGSGTVVTGGPHTGNTDGTASINNGGTTSVGGNPYTGTTGRGNITNVGTRPATRNTTVTYNNSSTHNVTSRSGGTYQNANINRATTNYSLNRSIATRR